MSSTSEQPDSGESADPAALETRARALTLAARPLDLHVDSLIQNALFGYRVERAHRAGLRGQPLFWHADLPRMNGAGYGGACLGIHYFPWERSAGTRAAHRQINALDRAAEQAGCLRIRSPDDWQQAWDNHLLGLAPGLEGAHILNGKIENLHEFCDRGISYLTLAHFSKNSAATPSMGRGANEEDGLTPFGHQVVETLNRRGVVVDVSHLNQRCALEAATLSRAPVMATHSGSQAVHAHRRLLSPGVIDAIAAGGGAVGIIFSPHFLQGRRKADSEAVADHVEAIAAQVGIQHVALGSDYDGWLPAILSDHRDCRDIWRITAALLRRGFSESEVRGVLSGNARRVFQGAWAARDNRA